MLQAELKRQLLELVVIQQQQKSNISANYDGSSSWTATGAYEYNKGMCFKRCWNTNSRLLYAGGEPGPDATTKTETYNGATLANSPATLGNPTQKQFWWIWLLQEQLQE